jgi:uncharacterized protein YuzE
MNQVDMEYDESTDSLCLAFNDAAWAYQESLDDRPAIDRAADSTVIGIEVLSASRGSALDGLPYVEYVERILVARGFPVRQPR